MQKKTICYAKSLNSMTKTERIKLIIVIKFLKIKNKAKYLQKSQMQSRIYTCFYLKFFEGL